MKIIILFPFILFFTSLNIFGQESKVIEYKNKKSKELISVLASNESIYQGKYEKYYKNELILEGFYNNGKKTGVWTNYENSKVISKTTYRIDKKNGTYIKYYSNGEEYLRGEYLNNIRIGEWSININGEKKKYNYVEESININDKKITDDADSLIYWIYTENDSTMITLDKQATLKHGKSYYTKFLIENLKYPQDAIEENIQGKVYVKFTVNENSKLVDFKIINGQYNSLDDEAIRVTLLMENLWNCATYQNKPFATKFYSPINFKLD